MQQNKLFLTVEIEVPIFEIPYVRKKTMSNQYIDQSWVYNCYLYSISSTYM